MNEEKVLYKIASELSTTYMRTAEPRKLLPNGDDVIAVLTEIQYLLYPQYFAGVSGEMDDQVCYLERLGVLYWRLTRLIHSSIAERCKPECKISIEGCEELLSQGRKPWRSSASCLKLKGSWIWMRKLPTKVILQQETSMKSF